MNSIFVVPIKVRNLPRIPNLIDARIGRRKATSNQLGSEKVGQKREIKMTIKEFVSKYIDCSRCTMKCCKVIDETAFIGTDENVPRDKMNKENTFFSAKNEKCTYFDGTFCSIYGDGLRPFLCKVYPFRIAGKKLFIDDWCLYGKEFTDAVNKNDHDLIGDLRSVRDWMINNVPLKLASFWSSREERLLGTELDIMNREKK